MPHNWVSDGQLATALDTTMMVAAYDVHGIILEVNDLFCTVTGYTQDELIGRHHTILRHPTTSIAFYHALWSTVSSGHRWKGLLENLTKTGETIYVSMSAIPLVDSEGRVTRVIGLFDDVTEIIKGDETALATFFDFNDSLIIVTDESFKPIMVNKALLGFMGASSLEYIFSNDLSICGISRAKEGYLNLHELHSWIREERLKHLYLLARSGSRRQLKVILVNQNNGEERIFTFHAYTIPSTTVATRMFRILSFNDITELEAMRAQTIADIKLSSIGKLAAGIIHEINTPITYIKGNLELLEMELSDMIPSEQRTQSDALITSITEGIARISSIIGSIREIAGVSSNIKQEHNLYGSVVYACRMIFNRAKQLCAITINDRPFDLGLDKDAQSFPAVIALQRIEQVWVILLNNALDEFAKSPLPFDQRRIAITLEHCGDGHTRICIADNAGGIPDHIISSIFDPFVSSKTESGMGIGLNIAKTIIDDHDGTIRVQNSGAGALFEIVL